MDRDGLGVFLEDHAEHRFAVLQDEIEVSISILDDLGGFEDLLQDGSRWRARWAKIITVR